MRVQKKWTQRFRALALTLGLSALFALPAYAESAEIRATATKDQVTVSGTVSGESTSEDGKLYFFALDPYNDSIKDAQPIQSAAYGANFSFRAAPGRHAGDQTLRPVCDCGLEERSLL